MHTKLRLMVLIGAAWSAAAAAGNIFTCIDDKGRKIVADRPIAQCTDRPQTEMSSSGSVKRVLGPTLTARERAAQDEQAATQAHAQARLAEEKRLNRALLLRYPQQALHDKERSKALGQIDEVLTTASQRASVLAAQGKQISSELARYNTNQSNTPAALKRRHEENQTNLEIQTRFIAEQELEKTRINTRFDLELIKLKSLWANTVPALITGASAASTPSPVLARQPR